ncbi:MAG: HPr family phosphocarrier protein [Eubacteriales bacterium]|nr:HPr family phosphocarrier protein [Eubacteriales bacterium]
MTTVKISLRQADLVKKFVGISGNYPYDMDLRIGRHVVDAKSILGIFSLDLSKEVFLDIHSDDCEDIVRVLEPFIVK